MPRGDGVTAASAPAASASANAAESRRLDEEAVKILIVDDRPENLIALEAILDAGDLAIIRAESGSEALKAVLQHDFACILLDVQMPGLNGFETAQLIKSRERSRAVPIIFLTAISKEEAYVFQGYASGAVDYMAKPFQPDILRSKVQVFVEMHRQGRQLRRQQQLLAESERRELEFQHRATLAESEAKTAEIVESAMDAIVTFGNDQKITLFNAAAERMFCTASSRAIGSQISNLFATPFDEDLLSSVRRAEPQRDFESCDDPAERVMPAVDLTGRRGSIEFPVEASISCLELSGEKTYTLIGRDITERRAQEAALRDQAVSLEGASTALRATNEELELRQRDLERAMTARNRFYANMSHELRTPINAIIGYNTLMLDNIYGPLNEKQQHGLQRVHKAAKHLLELVNDVLDLSKIEAGKIELGLQAVSMPSLVEDLFVTLQPLADEHKVELRQETPEGLPAVLTDPRRSRQILINLLSNAIKFGAGKPIAVRHETTESGGVMVSVSDEGPGIATEDLTKVFDEFVQLANHSPHTQGTGLGLPISKRLAALLGGELTVESTLGEGATFRLILPKEPPGMRG